MLDGHEIVCGELRWKMRYSMLDGHETVQIACGKLRREMRYSMLDGHETLQIACGELRWEGARQHSSRG